MTIVLFMASIFITGACETIVNYFGINIEAKIKEMQFGKEV